MDIDGLRDKMDDIDEEIAELFCERLRISADLAKHNAQRGIAVIDPEREREKLDMALDKADPELRGYVADLQLRIFELDRSYLGGIVGDTEGWSVESANMAIDPAEDQFIEYPDTSVFATGLNIINIALIGMPGCGKTSIGRYLSSLLRWEFNDTDELVAKKAGKSIERILTDDGEGAYRDFETAVLKEVTKRRGCVIATGAGVVKRVENKDLLRRNCTVVFLDRTPTELLSDGAAKSDLFDLKSIYLDRLPLYVGWSDYEVTTRGGVEHTAQAIKETLQR